jgi:hypothetical protein
MFAYVRNEGQSVHQSLSPDEVLLLRVIYRMLFSLKSDLCLYRLILDHSKVI